jgi:hypothetical protein
MGGIASLGSSIARGDGEVVEAFTTVAEVVSISGLPLSQDVVDTTTLDSANRYEEAVSTVIRTGEVELGLNFVPTDSTHLQFITDMEDGEIHNFRITFSDSVGTAWTIPAFVVGFNIGDINPESKLEATATLKISGQPTFS